MDASSYLPPGLPIPVAEPDRLSAPFWDGLRKQCVLIQRCTECGTWQFAPEWVCHHCHSFELAWTETPAQGRIHSWERVWHPVHPVLKDRCPYVAVLVELPAAGHVRLVGNLLGDPLQDVRIGSEVTGVFEHHSDATPPFTLLQWRCDPSSL